MPGAKVASTRRIFSAAVQRRRRWTEVMISTRSEVLVIRSVISLTLPKWETLSGHFGGNLTDFVTYPSQPKRCHVGQADLCDSASQTLSEIGYAAGGQDKTFPKLLKILVPKGRNKLP